MVCYFCGCPMEKENVNKKCPLNKPDSQGFLFFLYIYFQMIEYMV